MSPYLVISFAFLVMGINSVMSDAGVCNAKADIFLVLDASASIGSDDFNRLLDFAKKLVSGFNIGPKDIQFGGIVFSRDARVVFDLNDNDNIEGLQKGLSNVEYLKSSTYTHIALDLFDKDQLFSPDKGGRPGNPQIVVLFTDGTPVSESKAIEASRRLQESGVRVITIGIGENVDLDFLVKISTSPEDVINVSSYDKLEFIEGPLTQLFCQESE